MIPPTSANKKMPVMTFNNLDPNIEEETNNSLRYDHKLIDQGIYSNIVV